MIMNSSPDLWGKAQIPPRICFVFGNTKDSPISMFEFEERHRADLTKVLRQAVAVPAAVVSLKDEKGGVIRQETIPAASRWQMRTGRELPVNGLVDAKGDLRYGNAGSEGQKYCNEDCVVEPIAYWEVRVSVAGAPMPA